MAGPNTTDLRRFLTECFSDEELTTLCFDYFRDVYEEFAVGMAKGQKVQRLIERCVRREMLPNLLAALHAERTAQYEARFGVQAPTVESRSEQLRPSRDPQSIFITHAHEDAEFAHRLAADLRANGWGVWITPDSILAGERWTEAIGRGLDACGIFLLLLTPAAVQSRWVKTETDVAIELEHKGAARLIPVEVAQCDVPTLWSAYQFISFRVGYQAGLAALLGQLGTGRGSASRTGATREGEQSATIKPTAPSEAVPVGTEELIESGASQPTPAPIPKGTSDRAEKRRVTPLVWGAGCAVLLLLASIVWGRSIWNVVFPPAMPTPTVRVAAIFPSSTPRLAPSTPTQALSTLTSVPVPPTLMTKPALPTPTPPPALALGSTRVSEKDGMVMVWVPAGEFTMGSADTDAIAYGDEKPQHKVFVDGFWISRTEVTNAQYAGCVKAGACAAPGNQDYNRPEFANRPVIGVSWHNANEYARWVGGRLPTEAEWEKACRGTDARSYPWGNDSPTNELANYYQSGGTVKDVGSYPKGASPYGLLDMAGNVWEWTSSLDISYKYDATDGREDPKSNAARALRGGSFGNVARAVRCACRDGGSPGYRYGGYGFRVVSPGF